MPEILHLTFQIMLLTIMVALIITIYVGGFLICKDIIKTNSNKKQNKQ